MSWIWFFFACLTAIGGLSYNIGVKFGTAAVNPYAFTVTLAVTCALIQVLFFLTAKYVFHADVAQGVHFSGLKFAVLAGCAAAMIDIAYFFAVRYGSVIASQLFWTVGGTVLVVGIAILFFNETLTLQKAVGIVLGLASVILLTKQS